MLVKLFLFDQNTQTLGDKIRQLPWGLLVFITMTACVGFAMLYSAAKGDVDPWSSRQMVRFGIGVFVMLAVGLIDIRIWMRWAYMFYFAILALLIGVEIAGHVGMGAQRWLNLGFIQLQPSELMKLALVLALARYFHNLTYDDTGRIGLLIVPVAIIAVPTALVLKQPDLGTAVILGAVGVSILFLAGVRLWVFGVGVVLTMLAIPVVAEFLHDYQKRRLLTFLDPEAEPQGAGYHIMQSKIALGSGGLTGKGFMQGTQTQLNFLPEKQTDFIFTMYAEEFGLLGAVFLLLLFAIIIGYGFYIAATSRSQFGRLIGMGATVNFFLYMFINIAMVIGLIPVVGVPLPLVSYGGTAMLTVMLGFGLLANVAVHREIRLSRGLHGPDP